MSAHFRTTLVNGRAGDPALLLELPQHAKAILFDAGDLSSVDTRMLRRVSHLFLSHAHIDHIIGFDALLRAKMYHASEVAIFGPHGTIGRIGHRLRGYEWDLVDRIEPVLAFTVHEVSGASVKRARFVLQKRFNPEGLDAVPIAGGLLLDEPWLKVRTAVLRHHGPVLAFRAEAPAVVTVDAGAIVERGWSLGPWIAKLKTEVLAGSKTLGTPSGSMSPAALSDMVRVVPGESLGYVTDVADTPANRRAAQALVAKVDTLFIEAPFLDNGAPPAAERGHLSARAAGEVARAAGAGRVEPFHFSARHADAEMLAEVATAFTPRVA
ncbi:MAG: MBL fold metallo-hydrolase [Pseudomonadota bacterium]